MRTIETSSTKAEWADGSLDRGQIVALFAGHIGNVHTTSMQIQGERAATKRRRADCNDFNVLGPRGSCECTWTCEWQLGNRSGRSLSILKRAKMTSGQGMRRHDGRDRRAADLLFQYVDRAVCPSWLWEKQIGATNASNFGQWPAPSWSSKYPFYRTQSCKPAHSSLPDAEGMYQK